MATKAFIHFRSSCRWINWFLQKRDQTCRSEEWRWIRNSGLAVDCITLNEWVIHRSLSLIHLNKMPALFILFRLRFYFYSKEHLPIHIHVQNADGKAKFSSKRIWNLLKRLLMKIRKLSSPVRMNTMAIKQNI